MCKNINNLQKVLQYFFKDNSFLKEALTHSSYASEKHLPYDNQRLEFLGDAAIEIVVTEYLFNKFQEKTEGELTSIRSSIVQKTTLANAARIIELQDYLFLGKGEKDSDGGNRDSTLCDAFEAVMGAVYLDGGINCVREVFFNIADSLIEMLTTNNFNANPKGLLQEILQREKGLKPVYILKNVEGPQHAPIFTIELFAGKEKIAEGKGPNKKQAEVEAAEAVLKNYSQS